MAELSPAALVAVNIGAWLLIHVVTAWLATQLGTERFRPASWLFRARRFEQGGAIYERLLCVNRWKPRLPDGAALFRGGFRKKRLAARDGAYLERFVRETCRGELAHWMTLLAPPVFALWNPGVAVVAMVVYALVASLPFIIVQRYNRFRLDRLLARRSRRAGVERRPSVVAFSGADAILGHGLTEQP
jgi:glycosyl-4,4'-diaponeurosporenoate acyltransferase